MSYKKFKFISPGIFVNEIDNSQLPALPAAIGPAVIGRLARGPALKPVQVDSFSEFIEIFGNPIPGGQGGDVFRYGNFTSPTYAAYAAQAWLRNNSPVTMVRLLGQTHASAEASGYAGWATAASVAASTDATSNNGAYGLFVVESTASSPALASKYNLGYVSGSKSSIGVSTLKADMLADAQKFKWGTQNQLTGTLAAMFYITNGSIALSGNVVLKNTASAAIQPAATSSAFTFVEAVDSGPTFKAVIKNSNNVVVANQSFNFDPDSPNFIRKVFNTNPIKTNADVMGANNTVNYWVGESFEGNLRTFERTGGNGITAANPKLCWGAIMRVGSPDETQDHGNFKMSPTKSPKQQFAKTGWFIAQDLTTDSGSYNPAAQQKLFRLASRELGEETQRKIKIGIKDLRAADPLDPNQYGTFTLVIRAIDDVDAAPVILEQYNNCTLDPASNNFIAKKIGDKFAQWDDNDRRYRVYGDFVNLSSYVYVEMHDDVNRAAADPKCLPYGVFGPPRYVGWGTGLSGTVRPYHFRGAVTASAATGSTGAFVMVGVADPAHSTTGAQGTHFSASLYGASKAAFQGAGSGSSPNAGFLFPTLRLRKTSNEGASLADPHDAYFGVDTTYNSSRFDDSVIDVLRTRCEDIDSWGATSGLTEVPWVFSLDDVRNSAITNQHDKVSYKSNATYQSGSRRLGISYTAHTGSKAAATPGPATASYLNVIDTNHGGDTAGWQQFVTCLHGGADGLDITESDPFRNSQWTTATSETKDAPFNSVAVGMDCLSDPEVVEYNVATMPGLTNTSLNNKIVDMCEKRGDSLAIIDLDGGYQPPAESSNGRVARRGQVKNVVNNKKNKLKINSSYGCAYYPWVQIRDTIAGVTLWAPPSVVALGALSYGEANSQLWFAPAGFTRGGLSANRAGGVPVVGVEEKLTSKQRDRLYENQINPIASFPAEGIVIFGQKTLQVGASALDRINVRRLLIYLKKQVSRFAATILFDQNVEVTWTRFKSKVEPFLADVKAGLGLTDYKVILDETTTTPDLVDRNIMYAKIYIKPARSIEYIAIDFVITNSGASFED